MIRFSTATNIYALKNIIKNPGSTAIVTGIGAQ